MKLNKPKFWDREKSKLALLLLPLSLITIFIVFLKKKVIKKIRFKIPIICIGNIYIGGTGKTPASILIAKELKSAGKKPGIIRKYYKTHEDEYEFIKDNFKDLIIKKNRIEAINTAIGLNLNGVILDDGFQDYKIKSNLNILCFNQKQKIGNGFIFPAGPLRHSLKLVKDAQIILINGKKDIVFEEKLLQINNDLSFFYSFYKPQNINEFTNKRLIAIAGIGNPDNFFDLLNENNLNVVKKLTYPDHYEFNQNEISKLINESDKQDCQIITTEKDFYRVRKFKFDKMNYLKVKLEINDKEKLVNKIINYYDQNY